MPRSVIICLHQEKANCCQCQTSSKRKEMLSSILEFLIIVIYLFCRFGHCGYWLGSQSMYLPEFWSGRGKILPRKKGVGLSEHSEREFYYDSIQESCIFDCQVLPLIVCDAFLCVYVGCVYVLVGLSHSQKGLSVLGTNFTHTGVITMQVDLSIVFCLVCCLPFIFVFHWKTFHVGLE